MSDISCGMSIDKEALIGWNPDTIFISPVSLSIINNELKSTPYQDLKAVKEKKYIMSFPIVGIPITKKMRLQTLIL